MIRSIAAFVILLFAFVGDVSAEKPNFIFILADDSGFSDLGCYGSEVETPNLDSLASNGLRFTQFYNTGRCWPTRASLLTGYYPHQVNRDKIPGIGGGAGGKRQKWARLLPDFLRPYGYRNYHSGKWHIDGKTMAAGFDRSLNMRNQGDFFSNSGNQIDDQPVQPLAEGEEYYATTATVDHAIDCLKEHSAEHNNKPFFHYVAFIAPHFPLHAPQGDIKKYADKYLTGWEKLREQRYARQLEMGLHGSPLSKLEPEVGPPYHFAEALEKLGPSEVNRPLEWEQLTEEQKKFQATKMAIHAAMIDRMDQEIGRLIEQLKAMGQFENTVIFFASDNGASAEIMVRNGGHDPEADPGSAASYLCLGPGFSSACNTPFRRHKTWVHEGGISTPLIAHWPNGIKAKNELRRTPSHMIDIVPTILDLAGIEKPTEWSGQQIPRAPGKSLVPTFKNDATVQRDSLWWFHERNRAIRVGDYKLVAAKNDPWALYDLSKDRAESEDLIETFPGLAKKMEAMWQKQLEELSEFADRKASSSGKKPSRNRR